MEDYTPHPEESDCNNLSLNKTPLSTLSDFLPTFPQTKTNENDQDPLSQFNHEPDTIERAITTDNQVQNKRLTPPQAIKTSGATEKHKRSTSAIYRPPQKPWKSTLRGYERSGYSPSPSLNSSGLYSSMPIQMKDVMRSRDGSPSELSLYMERKHLNRSLELKTAIREANSKAHSKSRASGKIILETKNQRKEIATQVSSLENRIKKLRQEENQTMKRMEQASREIEKTLAVKNRKQGESVEKEQRSKAREESTQKRRAEINTGRDKAKMNASNAVMEMLKGRYVNAQTMKKEADEKKRVELERRKQEEERKRAVKEGIKSWIQSSKTVRSSQEGFMQKRNSVNYVERAKMEREKAQELIARSKELEDYERELIGQLTKAHEEYKARIGELQKIKVDGKS